MLRRQVIVNHRHIKAFFGKGFTNKTIIFFIAMHPRAAMHKYNQRTVFTRFLRAKQI